MLLLFNSHGACRWSPETCSMESVLRLTRSLSLLLLGLTQRLCSFLSHVASDASQRLPCTDGRRNHRTCEAERDGSGRLVVCKECVSESDRQMWWMSGRFSSSASMLRISFEVYLIVADQIHQLLQ